MDRQDILRGYRHAEQQADQDPLERTGALALLVVPAEQRQDLVGQRMATPERAMATAKAPSMAYDRATVAPRRGRR
ncbi:hypothetical protein BH77_21455 [Pseudomonas aeruginosa C2773C]|nr:hypothetical protein BH77_21455 [Pseudomonas aeruginosa C2773C]